MLLKVILFILACPLVWGESLPKEYFLIRQRLEGAGTISQLRLPVVVPLTPALVPMGVPKALYQQTAPAVSKPTETSSGAGTKTEVVKIPASVFNDIGRLMVLIKTGYPGELTDKELRDAALGGMLRELDPHSMLLRPKEMQAWQESTRGAYGGVGFVVGRKEINQLLLVRFPMPNSPASKAGINAGDMIVKIDDEDVLPLNLEECTSRLRGPPGTKVKLTIVPKDSRVTGTYREIELVRAEIQTPVLGQAMSAPGIGYIYFASFNQNAASVFKKALVDLKSQGMKALIIDLRENPGGLVSAAIDISSHFLIRSQAIFVACSKQGCEKIETAKDGEFRDIKVAILINSGSASASEIVSGALQANKKAVLIGSPSYGKGSAQRIFADFPEKNYGIKMTIERWFVPSETSFPGRSIERDKSGVGGLTPDIAVAVSFEEEAKLAEQRYLKLMGQKPDKPAADKVLETALQYLQGKNLAFSQTAQPQKPVSRD